MLMPTTVTDVRNRLGRVWRQVVPVCHEIVCLTRPPDQSNSHSHHNDHTESVRRAGYLRRSSVSRAGEIPFSRQLITHMYVSHYAIQYLAPGVVC